jgi:hypothetical protein
MPSEGRGKPGLPLKQNPTLAGVAQLVERILGRDEVTGSSPVIGSVFLKKLYTKYIKEELKLINHGKGNF